MSDADSTGAGDPSKEAMRVARSLNLCLDGGCCTTPNPHDPSHPTECGCVREVALALDAFRLAPASVETFAWTVLSGSAGWTRKWFRGVHGERDAGEWARLTQIKYPGSGPFRVVALHAGGALEEAARELLLNVWGNREAQIGGLFVQQKYIDALRQALPPVEPSNKEPKR